MVTRTDFQPKPNGNTPHGQVQPVHVQARARARISGRMGGFGQNVVGRPELVGRKQANVWGLYDMHGNAWEWVQDWYDAKYYSGSPVDDPKGPATGQYRVLRGGSALSEARFSRSSTRHFIGSTANTDYYGLRIVRDAGR